MIQAKVKKIVRDWSGVIITVPITSALVIGLRWLSLLQPLEWAALDVFFQLRPLEPRDERIVIVGIGEADIQKWRERKRGVMGRRKSPLINYRQSVGPVVHSAVALLMCMSSILTHYCWWQSSSSY